VARGLSRRTFITAAGAVGAGGLISACSASAPAPAQLTPRRGGALTNVIQAEITNLDPGRSGDQPSLAAFTLIYEGLISYSPDLEIRPGLALSWQQESPNSWTFKLRPGVKFHDGTPFNANAVKINFDRYLNPPKDQVGLGRLALAVLDRVDVIDDMTVRLVTKKVDAFFIDRVADACGGTTSWGFIISPAAIERYGADLSKIAVGTGPFKFVEWAREVRFVAARFDDYWGDKAYLDQVILRVVPEAEARAIGLEAGDVHLARTLNPESATRIENHPSLKTSVKTTTRSLFIGMASLKKPYSDLRVRQALNHAIDKDSIVKNVYAGYAQRMNGPSVPGQVGYVETPGFNFDPARAKRLLAEAGYPNGFSATMVGPKGAYFKDFEMQQAVQLQLRDVGVTVKLEILEFAQFLTLLRMPPDKSPLELYLDATGGGPTVHWIEQRYGCNFFRPVGTNTAGTCYPEIDAILDQAQKSPDESRRLALLKDAQERVSAQAPSIWSLATKEIAGHSRKVHNIHHRRTGLVTVDQHTWMET